MKCFGFLWLLLLLDLPCCRQPFNPSEILAQNNWLVVDGFINARPDSTDVTLSRSQNFSDSGVAFVPETGAWVSILGSNNDIYPLVEIGGGLYSTFGLNLNPSETYRLNIVTAAGEQYQSDSLVPTLTPPIDSVSWHADSSGVNTYVSTHDPTSLAKYYKWDFTETWERQAQFTSLLEYIDGQLVLRPPQNQIYTCWKSQNSSSIIINTSAKLSQDVIAMQPLQFIPMASEQMFIEYSIQVRQYAIDYNAYIFWQSLLNTTELTGSIFDQQPTQVIGNIHSVSNPKEPVLGYTSVSTESQKRLFIYRDDLNYWLDYPTGCLQDTVSASHVSIFADSLFLVPLSEVAAGYTFTTVACGDCRYGGASNMQPILAVIG